MQPFYLFNVLNYKIIILLTYNQLFTASVVLFPKPRFVSY